MAKIKYVDWDKPMNDVEIKGEIVTVPVWGGMSATGSNPLLSTIIKLK